MLNSFLEIAIFFFFTLLSFLMLTNPLKVNRKGNFWLGIALLLWGSFWLDEVLSAIGETLIQTDSVFLVRLVRFTTPFILYLSVSFFTNPNFSVKKNGALYLVLPMIFCVLNYIGHTQHLQDEVQPFIISIVLTHSALFAVLSLIKIHKHQQQIQRISSNTDGIDLKWLKYILSITMGVVIIIGIFNIFFYKESLGLFVNFVMFFSALGVGYYALNQKEIYPVKEALLDHVIAIHEEEIQDIPKKKVVQEEKLVELKSHLLQIMKEKEPFLDSDINLASLSELLDITPHQLSYVINNGFNENFFQFINRFRVEKAKSLLASQQAEKLSMIGIAFESGFSSKTSFNTSFKKRTGMTPSEYKKSCSNL